jgi:hypothetical protein
MFAFSYLGNVVVVYNWFNRSVDDITQQEFMLLCECASILQAHQVPDIQGQLNN